jgi:hypothetical protein
MENIPTNPLNTGNGAPSSSPATPVPPQTPATPVTPAPTSPTPIFPTTTPGSTPTPATPVAPNMIEKALAMKKYIIAAVAVVALLGTAYMAYSYYTGISDAVTDIKEEAVDLNNKLSAPSETSTQEAADKAKLNEVVNELKDQYKTDNPTTDTTTPSTDTTSTPPGMNIEITPTTDTTTTTETSGVKR